MDLSGFIVDSTTRAAIPNATVQSMYPDGGHYGAANVLAADGKFVNPIPDRTYKFFITAPGYKPKMVTIENYEGGEVTIGLTKGAQDLYDDTPGGSKSMDVASASVQQESVSGTKKNTKTMLVVGGVALLAVVVVIMVIKKK